MQYWSIDYENGFYYLAVALREARQLSYDGDYLITVLFTGVYGSELYCEAGAEYVGEFLCYREDRFPSHSRIHFSIGFLEVTCSKIEIASVEDIKGGFE